MSGRPSPEVASIRGRVAGLSRDRSPDDPELVEARQELAEARAERKILDLLAAPPLLSDATRSRLADLLRPPAGGDAA